VSRVVNGHSDVSDETRAKVQQVITQLRYRPNGIARSLIKRSSQTLGIVASGFQLFGPAQLLTGIEREATALGWHVMLQIVDPADPNDYDRVAGNLLSENVDGVVWAYPELTGEREHEFHQQIKPFAPIVFLSMEAQPDSAVISVDNRYGARMVTEHLITRGYHHIGIITGPMTLWSSQQRKLGWSDALATARMPSAARQVVAGDWSAASGDAGLVQLLKQYPKLDAVLACNDQMALGALSAAHRIGRKVPGDLGVVGFDNTPESAFFTPPLTTVHHDLIALGQLAVRELNRVIRSNDSSSMAPAPSSLMLQPHLVLRQSA
jgi:DNA-binding LacI/PurR family transcriptional regulator